MVAIAGGTGGRDGVKDCVVITGAAHGIGRATAVLFADSGWIVVGVDVDESGLNEVADSLESFVPVVGDVADPRTHLNAREEAERAGRLRAWVNNAAVVKLAPLHDVDNAEIERQLRINLLAVILGCREAAKAFIATALEGCIINVSSVHARYSFPGYGVYDTCKGGVEALTRSMCVEYGHLGIRCNAIAPGAVRTGIATAGATATLEEEAEAAALAPMRRISEPTEIAESIYFLASDQARSINGHVLAVDNGISARGHGLSPKGLIEIPVGTTPADRRPKNREEATLPGRNDR